MSFEIMTGPPLQRFETVAVNVTTPLPVCDNVVDEHEVQLEEATPLLGLRLHTTEALQGKLATV